MVDLLRARPLGFYHSPIYFVFNDTTADWDEIISDPRFIKHHVDDFNPDEAKQFLQNSLNPPLTNSHKRSPSDPSSSLPQSISENENNEGGSIPCDYIIENLGTRPIDLVMIARTLDKNLSKFSEVESYILRNIDDIQSTISSCIDSDQRYRDLFLRLIEKKQLRSREIMDILGLTDIIEIRPFLKYFRLIRYDAQSKYFTFRNPAVQKACIGWKEDEEKKKKEDEEKKKKEDEEKKSWKFWLR